MIHYEQDKTTRTLSCCSHIVYCYQGYMKIIPTQEVAMPAGMENKM